MPTSLRASLHKPAYSANFSRFFGRLYKFSEHYSYRIRWKNDEPAQTRLAIRRTQGAFEAAGFLSETVAGASACRNFIIFGARTSHAFILQSSNTKHHACHETQIVLHPHIGFQYIGPYRRIYV
jgi:hypothetical protein